MRKYNWERGKASVIPAKAGIHPLAPLDAGLRRHDDQGRSHMVLVTPQFHTL